MSHSYLISVIIPVYQVEALICNCLQSLVSQSFKNFEIILVNDGTKDKSIEIADAFLKGQEIDYRIICKENGGQASARNLGVKEARGKYIVFVDSDDTVCEDYLATLYQNITNTNCNVAIANYQRVNEETLFSRPQRHAEPVIMDQKTISERFLVRKINIVVTSMIIDREEFIEKNLWFDESVRFGEDFFFYWRLLASQDKVVYNETPIYNYFIRNGSTTTTVNIGRMLTNENALPKLREDLERAFGEKFAQLVIARQSFAMLRICAMFGDYSDYIGLYRKINFDDTRKILMKFPDIRVRALVASMYVNKRLFYMANHRRG